MSPTNQLNYIFYLGSLSLAFMLRILPLPPSVQLIAPDWVLLVLIYWLLSEPHKIGIFHAFLIGLLIDVLTGRILGQHPSGYIFAAYLCLTLHKRLQNIRLIQQCFFIFFILFITQSIILWTEIFQHPLPYNTAFWLPALSGTLFWPVIKYLLRRCHQGFH